MRVFFGIILFCGGLNLQAICQFTGGSFDGSHAILLLETFSHQFHGGSEDGSTSLELNSGTSEIYAGGDGDGHHAFEHISSTTLYVGGFGGGYDLATLSGNSVIGFTGGNGSGYILSTLFSDDIPPPFTGGQGDGYSQLTIRTLIWTGDFGTNWNDAGNWNRFIVPTSLDIAFIPNNKPNYPLLDGGYLCIGDVSCPDSVTYVARSVGIAANGRIDGTNGLRINNAGEFNVRGTLNLYDLSFPFIVFRNLEPGQLILGPGAEVTMKR